MQRTRAVCFLWSDGEILLRERSGVWDAISGAVTDTSPEACRGLVEEHVEIDGKLRLETHETADDRGGAVANVVVAVFDCDRQDVSVTDRHRWCSPTELRHLDTEHDLWRTYRRVRPTVETIRQEYELGSAYLSVRSLEVLRDEAAIAVDEGGSREDVLRTADELVRAQPTMEVIVNRLSAVIVESETLRAIERNAHEYIETASMADAEAAANAATYVDGNRVLTVSRSGTVLSALERAAPEHVTVTESRTDDEGLGAAERLASRVETRLITDAAVGHELYTEDVDVVLTGADTILPDGSVVNKIGTRPAALAATHEDVPVYVVSSRAKICPQGELRQDHRPDDDLYGGDAGVDVRNPVFDLTPPELLSGIVTEDGTIDPGAISDVATQFAEMRGWRR